MERLLRIGLFVFLFFIYPCYGIGFFDLVASNNVTMSKDKVLGVYYQQVFVRELNSNISYNLKEYDSILICDNCFSTGNVPGTSLDEFPSKRSISTIPNPTVVSGISFSRYFVNDSIVYRQASYLETRDYVFMDYIILDIGQTDIMTAIIPSYIRSFSVLTYYIDGSNRPILELRSYNIGFIVGDVFLSVIFPLRISISFLY